MKPVAEHKDNLNQSVSSVANPSHVCSSERLVKLRIKTKKNMSKSHKVEAGMRWKTKDVCTSARASWKGSIWKFSGKVGWAQCCSCTIQTLATWNRPPSCTQAFWQKGGRGPYFRRRPCRQIHDCRFCLQSHITSEIERFPSRWD